MISHKPAPAGAPAGSLDSEFHIVGLPIDDPADTDAARRSLTVPNAEHVPQHHALSCESSPCPPKGTRSRFSALITRHYSYSIRSTAGSKARQPIDLLPGAITSHPPIHPYRAVATGWQMCTARDGIEDALSYNKQLLNKAGHGQRQTVICGELDRVSHVHCTTVLRYDQCADARPAMQSRDGSSARESENQSVRQ